MDSKQELPCADKATEKNLQSDIQRIPLKGMRKTIAKRMVESLHTMAQMTTSAEVDATDLLELRKRLAAREESIGTRITVTDLFARAIVKALMNHPYANASMTDTEILLYPYVNLNIAIALPGGLISPVVRNTEKMSLVELSKTIKELTEKARAKKLQIEDLTDVTFTISSLGSNASGGAATPIINPPQAGIVQFGPAVRKPVVINEELVIRSMMIINYTFDHRLLDGDEIRKLIREVKGYIENPETILI